MKPLLRVSKGELFLNPRDGVMEIVNVDPKRAEARLRHHPMTPSSVHVDLPVIFGGIHDWAVVPLINDQGMPDYDERRIAYRFPVIVWEHDIVVRAA